MQRTDIEWVVNPDGSRGFTSNPVTGKCRHGCPYCYAEGIRKRFGRPEAVSCNIEELEKDKRRKKPSTIFIGSMHDCFGNWVPDEVVEAIIETARQCPQHTILLLSKNAGRMWHECYEKMPENIWFGETVTHLGEDGSPGSASNGYNASGWIYAPRNSFISFEPLLEDVTGQNPKDGTPWTLTHKNTKWAIIGALNRNGRPVPPDRGGTKREWVMNLTGALDEAGIPVFIKDSLYELYPDLPVRREIPYLVRAAKNKSKKN